MTNTRTAAYLSILAFVMALLFAAPYTANAFYSDDALTGDASFDAGTLEITTDTDELATDITHTGTTSVLFETETLSSFDARYMITAEAQSCDSSFYNGITVVASHNGDERYSGPLASMEATSTSEGSWEFELSASPLMNAEDGDECDVKLTVDGWQLAFKTLDDGGFSDTKEIALAITADGDIGAQQTGTVVLNEIYPAPTSTTTEPLEREWVELYNGTNDPVDLEGWLIGEETGGNGTTTKHLISSSNTCASGSKEGFARPYDNAGTLIPAGGLVVIEFCAAHRLHNDGDTVSLYTSTTSPAIDVHTYPETENGKSNARIPDGSAWVDPEPTPGTSNTATREELRAEGWSEAEIDRVLKLLGIDEGETDKEQAQAADSGSGDGAVAGTTTATTTTKDTNEDQETQNTKSTTTASSTEQMDDASEEESSNSETSTTTGTTTSTTTTQQDSDTDELQGTSTGTTTDEVKEENDQDDHTIDETQSTSTEKEKQTGSEDADDTSGAKEHMKEAEETQNEEDAIEGSEPEREEDAVEVDEQKDETGDEDASDKNEGDA